MEKSDAQNRLRARIDLPSFQLDVSTTDTKTALTEIRRILEAIRLDEDLADEDALLRDLRGACSEEFLKHEQVLLALRAVVQDGGSYRIASAEIPSTTTLDFDNGTRTARVQRRDVQLAVSRITGEISGTVRRGIIHIAGPVDAEDRALIADHVHRAMPTAHLRAFHTPADRTAVHVECLFVGDFPDGD